MKEIREMSGVGKGTVRRALYSEGAPSARGLAAVLGEGLSEAEVRALEEELMHAPRKKFRKSSAEGV